MLLKFFGLLFISICMVAIPVLGNWNAHQRFDDTKFKRIKIQRGKRFFVSTDFQSVEKHGLVIPIFCMQLLSYPLAIVTLIGGTICLIINKDPIKISFILLGIEVLIDLVINIVLEIISKIRS